MNDSRFDILLLFIDLSIYIFNKIRLFINEKIWVKLIQLEIYIKMIYNVILNDFIIQILLDLYGGINRIPSIYLE